MKKIINLIMLMGVSCILVSCTDKTEKAANADGKSDNISPTSAMAVNVSPIGAITEEADPTDEKMVFKNIPEPEVICEGKNYQLIKLGLLEDYYDDYYECMVFDKNHKVIYLEILGPRPISYEPKMSVQNKEVNIHFGAGTGTYFDKYIDFEHNRKSEWIESAVDIGKEYVAYINFEETPKGDPEKMLVIAKKYEENSERKIPFPIDFKGFIDKGEFRNDETELYIHYMGKDAKKPVEKTIKLSEFK